TGGKQSLSLAFRQGRADDVPAVARLVQHSFPAATSALRDTEDYLLDSPHGGLETLWVGERDGRVIAACRLLRFRQWIGGRDLPIMGLATVAIAPTERRQGIAARLIESAFEHARDRGDAASLL